MTNPHAVYSTESLPDQLPQSSQHAHPCNPAQEKRLETKANMAWNAIGNLVYLFLQWLLTYVVVRELGYESAGVYSIAIALGNSFYGIAAYTMRNFQVSDVVDEFSNTVYLWSRCATCSVAFVLCCGFAALNGYAWATLACIVSFMAFRVTEAMSDVYQGMMQKRSRMDYVGISFLLRGVLGFAAFCAAVMATHDLLVAITAMTAACALVVAIYDRKYARCGKKLLGDSARNVGRLLLACLPLAVYGFLFNSMAQVPRLFVDGILGTEQLGYYTTVAMPVVIVQASATFLFSPLVTPMAEQIATGNELGFMSTVKKVVLFIAALGIVAAALFWFAGEPVLVLVFGDSIAPYAYLLLPLVACTVLTALAWFLASVVVVLREQNVLLVSSASSFLVTLAGSWWFVATFGLNGASYVLIVALVVFCIISAAAIARGVEKGKGSGASVSEG